MSKITFRADDALVDQLDELDASKSEVMREALREFLDRQPGTSTASGDAEQAVSDHIDARVNKVLEERLDEDGGQDINVNVNLADPGNATVDRADEGARAAQVDDDACTECGHTLDEEHDYCPNCGEEQTTTPHCECGEEIDRDWAFCPGCGRRSPTTDVLDRT